MRTLLDGLRPNRSITLAARLAFAGATLVIALFAWQLAPAAVPRPREVLAALAPLWTERGLFEQLVTSVTLNLEAIAWSSAITFGLAYLTVVPAVRPLVAGVTKLRFTGMVGWGFVLALLASGGHQLKLWMLVFGMVPFFLTSMVAVVAAIPRERFDHARTLGLSEWRIVWEVVVRGTADQALETLRHNAAMGWMMLAMVEGIVRGEGGIGVLMVDENKHLHLAGVFALIGVVLAV